MSKKEVRNKDYWVPGVPYPKLPFTLTLRGGESGSTNEAHFENHTGQNIKVTSEYLNGNRIYRLYLAE